MTARRPSRGLMWAAAILAVALLAQGALAQRTRTRAGRGGRGSVRYTPSATTRTYYGETRTGDETGTITDLRGINMLVRVPGERGGTFTRVLAVKPMTRIALDQLQAGARDLMRGQRVRAAWVQEHGDSVPVARYVTVLPETTTATVIRISSVSGMPTATVRLPQGKGVRTVQVLLTSEDASRLAPNDAIRASIVPTPKGFLATRIAPAVRPGRSESPAPVRDR